MKILNIILYVFLIVSLCSSLVYCNFIYDDGTGNPPALEGEGEGEKIPIGSDVGNMCPSYALDLVDGSGKVSVKDFKGKIVIVNFWGTWCGPCKQELPDFDRVATEYDGDVVVLTIHSVESSAEAPAYIAEHFPNSKMLFAYDIPLTEYVDMYFNLLGGTSYYPRTLILDERGVIALTRDGKLNHEQLVETIEEIKNK